MVMEHLSMNISRLFTEHDPKICIKSLKIFTKTLENVENIKFSRKLTLCLLSKFSESISNFASDPYRLICKEFLHFFTIYLKKCPFETYEDHFVSLVSQGLRLSDQFAGKAITAEIILLVDYFSTIFSSFKGKFNINNQSRDDISVEESLIGATIHLLLQFIENETVKNSQIFRTLNDISESIGREVAINYYPGVCSRLGKFLIKCNNDLSKAHALESLCFWITKILNSTHYMVKLKDKASALHKLTDYPVEYYVITENDTEFAHVIENTNKILAAIVKTNPRSPKLVTEFISFYGQLLEKCKFFISNTVHEGIIAYLLSNCKSYKAAAQLIGSESRHLSSSRDIVGRYMANDDFIASIDLFQGYHQLSASTSILPLDLFVVSKWMNKLLLQEFTDANFVETSLEKFFKYKRRVSTVIGDYYRHHLTSSDKHEMVESLTHSLSSHVAIDESNNSNSKWLANLNNFNSSNHHLGIELSNLIPIIANIGYLVDNMDDAPELHRLIHVFRILLQEISTKQCVNDEEKLLLCNIYWTLTKCIKFKQQLIESGFHTLLFSTIHIACYHKNISAYPMECMKGVHGDLVPLVSKYGNHLINTCRFIIRDFGSSTVDNFKFIMAKNVISFISKYGLFQTNNALSQLSLDLLSVPIHLKQPEQNCLIEPLVVDCELSNFDEEFVISVLNSMLSSFQREISNARGVKCISNEGFVGNNGDFVNRDFGDIVRDDDIVYSLDDILKPILPIDSLGKYGLYRRVATSVVARARHAMLLTESRYSLACKASISVLLSLYILSTDTSELLPRIPEIFPMVLKNINSSIVPSAYAMVILKYCSLVVPEFLSHKQPEIVNQIYARLMRSELAGDADERHLSSKFIFQSFALEYLVIITETRQFCLEKIFQMGLWFSRMGAAYRLKGLRRQLWLNLKCISPNRTLLLIRNILKDVEGACIMESDSAYNRDVLIGEILGVDSISRENLDKEVLEEIELLEPEIVLRIPSGLPLKQGLLSVDND